MSNPTSDVLPAELTGALKWTTVKISDSTKPTTDSIFLGADEVCLSVGVSVSLSVCLCLCSSVLLSMLLSVYVYLGAGKSSWYVTSHRG